MDSWVIAMDPILNSLMLAIFIVGLLALMILSRDTSLFFPLGNLLKAKPAQMDLNEFIRKGDTIAQKKKLYSLMHFTPGLTLEAIFEGFNQYNETLRKIAVKEKTGWVDNAALVPHEDKYFLDRVHFSSEGTKLVAKNFLPVVLDKLNEL